MLLSDGEPWPWFAVNSAIRAAQVISVARQLNIDQPTIRASLLPHHRSIGQEGFSDPIWYIDQLIKLWDRLKGVYDPVCRR